jgi:hypothetical protein
MAPNGASEGATRAALRGRHNAESFQARAPSLLRALFGDTAVVARAAPAQQRAAWRAAARPCSAPWRPSTQAASLPRCASKRRTPRRVTHRVTQLMLHSCRSGRCLRLRRLMSPAVLRATFSGAAHKRCAKAALLSAAARRRCVCSRASAARRPQTGALCAVLRGVTLSLESSVSLTTPALLPCAELRPHRPPHPPLPTLSSMRLARQHLPTQPRRTLPPPLPLLRAVRRPNTSSST